LIYLFQNKETLQIHILQGWLHMLCIMITQPPLRQACVENPHKPQYGGGIIRNPEFNSGLEGWSTFGGAKIEERVSKGDNKYIVAHSREKPYDSFSQKLYLHKHLLYTLSAWVQVNQGNASVRAVFKTRDGFKHAGVTLANAGCWSMLKGGLTLDSSGPAELYFESQDTSVEIWVDSISLQPFTMEEWNSHQQQSIEKFRKSNVKIQALDAKGNPLVGAKISIIQNALKFPLGNNINKEILNNPAHQKWFTERFTVTTFGNEMKWYSTENIQGQEDYSIPDAMLNFAKQNNIAVRGHNIFWDDPQYQPWWVKSLSKEDLAKAVQRRINSVVTRYSGQLIAWDVVNENLHFSFFESILGNDFSNNAYKTAHQLDPKTPLFLNEYNTIEESGDGASSPSKYLKKLRQIQSSAQGSLPMGIGLESHFRVPNLPYIRASLDTLASANVPIWLTEVDVLPNPNQANYLEQILREGYSHPAVKGIVMWAGRDAQGCYRMCLTDENFKNLPTGDVVDKLLREWVKRGFVGETDDNGVLEISLSHGDYEATIDHPDLLNSLLLKSFKVVPAESSEHQATLTVQAS
ncbi:Glycoside hydrolase family 10 domain, partial [Dillenia turbinata]